MRRLLVLFLFAILDFNSFVLPSFGIPEARADELKPAYIELTEVSDTRWRVFWKVSERSILGQVGLLKIGNGLQAQNWVPNYCTEHNPITSKREAGNLSRVAVLECSKTLWGEKIALIGLDLTNTDALVRVASSDQLHTFRLTPEKVSVELRKTESGIINNVALAYGVLGVEHILQGYDHLLFVIAMVLLITGVRTIVWTITAFTLAHSVTLIASTFGYISLPSKPVEAIIALSIVFLAAEIVKRKEGQLRLSETYPWLVAFLFGLLHGFGFAGALAEIGLPKGDVPLALLSFNLGVELGQLLIVGITLAILFLIKRWLAGSLYYFRFTSAYLIGITSTYWLIERL